MFKWTSDKTMVRARASKMSSNVATVGAPAAF